MLNAYTHYSYSINFFFSFFISVLTHNQQFWLKLFLNKQILQESWLSCVCYWPLQMLLGFNCVVISVGLCVWCFLTIMSLSCFQYIYLSCPSLHLFLSCSPITLINFWPVDHPWVHPHTNTLTHIHNKLLTGSRNANSATEEHSGFSHHAYNVTRSPNMKLSAFEHQSFIETQIWKSNGRVNQNWVSTIPSVQCSVHCSIGQQI